MKGWTREKVAPEERSWEEMYRNRFQHDKRVRSTHGCNCTGGCSWEVFVKDGIVTWELQATDYPVFNKNVPPYDPRGCPRGSSASWYLYNPLRVKYPYARGALIDLWREARETEQDPVAAWAAIVGDPEKRGRFQRARGKGGFRRISWDEAVEILAASVIHTVKTHGPDRVLGFTPIPAMSQASYASGVRFLSLLGGVVLSFYDWYADLPPASPEVWGEQTDVNESADWYHARFIAVLGSNVNQTRTPDAHYLTEARHAGAKVVVFTPDFSQTAKEADWWIPANLGQDGAFWLAVDHVIMQEYYVERQVPDFVTYQKRYTDMPFLVEIKDGRPFRCLRANRLAAYEDVENGDWKLLIWDTISDQPRTPRGTIGYRWANQDKGRWNLELKEGQTGEEIDPDLSFRERHEEILQVAFDDLAGGKVLKRGVPVRYVETVDGRVAISTVFDLMMAHFGVGRDLDGDYPTGYDDEDSPFTPAWQEKYSGIHRETVVRFARQWAENAEKTGGKNLLIIGNGANQWYHTNLIYRAAIAALLLTGSVGGNGRGMAHYVGQEKVAPLAAWSTISFAQDWNVLARLQNAPSFHYVHNDQWRYERGYAVYDPPPGSGAAEGTDHTIDEQIRAVRRGWMPFYPQFNKNPLQVVEQAQANGAATDQEIVDYVVDQLKAGRLSFAVEDPDAEENWPRVWFIWRANALGSSAKGHEYFLDHYLGTHTNAVGPEMAGDFVREARYRPQAPSGKMDLVVTLDFRMSTSALYSDVVLPAAMWYEKDDLNTTDLHSFLHPMQEAVTPAWEAKDDWHIFKAIARRVSELAEIHLPEPVKDLVMRPLAHDSPDELAQADVHDWKRGQVQPIPGKTMPKLDVIERDYVNLYEHMVSLGRGVAQRGLSAHGLSIPVADFYEQLQAHQPRRLGGRDDVYPALETGRQVVEAILSLDPISNGEVAYRAFLQEEKETGLKLADLAESTRGVRYSFHDIAAQPRRFLTTPTWSGIVNDGRTYAPFVQNVERLVPWRTLSGRQHFYLDHSNYIRFGEHLLTFKLPLDPGDIDETRQTETEIGGRQFRYITPHQKWGIHTTFSDNVVMMTLSRGCYPVWLNDKDAHEIGIRDNDWVELINDNGVYVQRCITSARIPRGAVYVYHATERTLGIPKSPLRGRRAGIHNSCTRTRLKPVLLSGGYAQFTYFFNYWGPTGVNRDTFVYVRRVEKAEF
jgi:nitrate reductase alpha subunit